MSPFAEEMLKIAASKACAPGMKSRAGTRPMRVSTLVGKQSDRSMLDKLALGRLGQGVVAGSVGTLGAQSGYKDWKTGRQVRIERKRQLKAQRLMAG